jgi:predicted hotdog family 3-hydroxylacyl-ACP dehydratase
MNPVGKKEGAPDPDTLTIAELLPHRGRMKLVDEILLLDDEVAVTAATATRRWPLFDGRAINPLVLVELVAQTAGIKNGLDRIRTQGPDADKRGWLVGIKQARFEVDAIYPGDRIVTRVWNAYQLETYFNIEGEATRDSVVIGRVSLQVIQASETMEEQA